MRKLVLACLLSIAVLAPAKASAEELLIAKDTEADPNVALGTCGNSENAGHADCLDKRTNAFVMLNDGGTPSTARPVSTSTSSSSGPTIRYVPYNRLTTDSNGQGCVTTGYVPEGSTPTDAAPRLADHVEGEGGYNNVYEEYPPCPEQPRAPGQAAPVETRAMVAARYWERVHLPFPQPSIAPGRAITGKLAYLETRGVTAHTYRNDTVFGPLEIVARGSYIIDWGDGERSGPHAFEGKPWPDGRITHDYLEVGVYDVVVMERWTATWRLGGESGVLRTLQTTGRIEDFPVEQIQAVIGR